LAEQRFLDGLRLATREELADALGEGGMGGAGIFTGSPGDVAAIIVFRILQDRFGRPEPGGDLEKSLWEWTLKSEHGVLSVYDWKEGWGIGYIKQGGLTPELREDARRLRDDLVQLAKRARSSAADAVGGVITNPYRLFSDMAESLLEQVAELRRDAEERLEASRKAVRKKRHTRSGGRKDGPTMPIMSEGELPTLLDLQLRTDVRRRSFLMAAMLAHILSLEGFLNLTYHLFTRLDVADAQVRTRVERQPLDLKLRLVHVFCDCFDRPPIDRHSDLYKAFLHLLSLRINLAHAKLTAAMEHAVVIEQGYPFLVPTDATTRYGITSDPLALDEKMLAEAGHIIRSIVRQTLRSMKREVRYPLAVVHRHDRIEYHRRKDGTAEIVLPQEEDHPGEWVDEMLASEGDEWHPDA